MPQNAYCINEFFDTYPQGKVIHIIRDGRDVLTSLRKRNVSDQNAAEIWLYSNALPLMWKNDSRFLCIRYEDLATNTDQILSSIQQHLGMPVEDIDAQRKDNRYWHRIIKSEQENIHGHWHYNPLYSPISPASIGSHKNALTQADIRQFLDFSADQMEYPIPENAFSSNRAIMEHFRYL